MSLLNELPLHPALLRALEKEGFVEATEVQARAIPPALAGRDLMVCARTGSGKTAAFLLPLLHRLLAEEKPRSATRALILLPTRELALQTGKTFARLAAFTRSKCGLVIGGEAFKHQVATLRKNPEVLIATPGRLVEHIEKKTTDFGDLEVLVLDEADRMLDMGFTDDMNKIAAACNSGRQTWLYSATLRHRGLHGISSVLREPEVIDIDSPRQMPEQISQQLIFADDVKHKENLVVALIAEEAAGKVFVFCNTREQCQQLGNLLKYKKLKVAFIHGEIPQSTRKQVMNQFRDGHLQVLVATDVAARGLDVDNVGLVINFTVAQSGNDYLHRAGRTGRAGQPGKVVTLVSATEYNLMSSIERYLKIRFEQRKIKGLEGSYRGPKKVKSSGKAAGPKKKKGSGEKKTAGKPVARAGQKKPARPKGPASVKPAVIGDGSGALRKRPPPALK